MSLELNHSTSDPLVSTANANNATLASTVTATLIASITSTIKNQSKATRIIPIPLETRTFVVGVIVTLLALYLNTVAAVTIFAKKAFKQRMYYLFLGNLTIASLISIITPFSGSILQLLNSRGIIPFNNYPLFAKIFLISPVYCSYNVMMHTLHFIAVERCYESLMYPKTFSGKNIKLLIVLTWIIGIAFTVPIALYTNCTNRTVPCHAFNHIKSPHTPYWMSFLALNYFIPAISLIVCYSIILKFQCGKTSVDPLAISEIRREDKKFLKLSLIATIAYISCQTPRCILILKEAILKNSLNQSAKGLADATRALSTLCLILLPLVYILFNSDIRRAYCPCCYQGQVLPETDINSQNRPGEKGDRRSDSDDDSM